MPSLPPMPMPMDLGQATPQTPTPPPTSSIKKEEEMRSEDPVVILIDGKRKWVCPKCEKVMGSRYGCDAHIKVTHTGKALACALCSCNIQP